MKNKKKKKNDYYPKKKNLYTIETRKENHQTYERVKQLVRFIKICNNTLRRL